MSEPPSDWAFLDDTLPIGGTAPSPPDATEKPASTAAPGTDEGAAGAGDPWGLGSFYGPTETVPPGSMPPADAPPGGPPGGDRNGRLRAALAGAVAGLVVGGTVAGLVVHSRTVTPRAAVASSTPATTAPAPVSSLPGGGLNVRGVLARVEPAVVSITDDMPSAFGTQQAAGTGMVIKATGEVLTNAHVVAGADNIQVTITGRGAHPARLLGADTVADVALIQVEGVSGLPTVTLGSSSALQVGDPLIAVGNALALDGGPTVTTGIVSALNRQIDTGTGSLTHLIQTDAPINRGNSGGPLLNAAGEVVGMNTAVAGGAQNIGFAIAVDQIKPLILNLERGQAAPSTSSGGGYLGISAQDGPSGAAMVQVASGSPAARAGLTPGDVIVAVDGTQISSAADLVTVIRSHHPGDRIRLQVQRQDGSTRTVTVTLAARPSA